MEGKTEPRAGSKLYCYLLYTLENMLICNIIYAGGYVNM